MSSRIDLDDARQLLLAELNATGPTAMVVAIALWKRYHDQALDQPRETVLAATLWATRRLNELPPGQLARMTSAEVLSQLQHFSDCPLCASGSDASHGSSSPATVPPVPVGADR